MKCKLERINEGFMRAGAAAMTKSDVKKVIGHEKDIIDRMTGALGKLIEDVKLFICMLKDYCSGAYREIPWWCIASVTFTLLYVLNPFDLIPDFIPVLGQIDDAAVVFLCLRLIGTDLAKYRTWKEGYNNIFNVENRNEN